MSNSNFHELIDEGLKAESNARAKPRIVGVYYISEIFECSRKIYYSYKTDLPEEPYSLSTLKNFAIGNAVHELVQKLLSHNGKYMATHEVAGLSYRRPAFEIHGRLDTLMQNLSDGSKIILELKTCQDARKMHAPLAAHSAQINFYLNFYKDAKGIVTYIGKTGNDDDIAAFNSITFSQELMKHTEERAAHIHSNIINNILPMPEGKILAPVKCKYCIFRTKCESDENVVK